MKQVAWHKITEKDIFNEYCAKKNRFVIAICEGLEPNNRILCIKEGLAYLVYYTSMADYKITEFIDTWKIQIEKLIPDINRNNLEEAKSISIRVVENTEIYTAQLTYWLNNDWNVLKIRNAQLEVDGNTFLLKNTFQNFEQLLIQLQEILPKTMQIESCFFCRYGDYSTHGHGMNGELFCFKNYKEGIQKIFDKDSFEDLWCNTQLGMIEKIDETHFCETFLRIKKNEFSWKNKVG